VSVAERRRASPIPMSRKVSHDQFNIEGDKLTHAPTGARFWLGETDVAYATGPARTKLPTHSTLIAMS
jgi:hypothetical protein